MSKAKAVWDTECTGRLDQLERIHADARGTRRGRRWETEQLNRSLFVALVGQFQVYCRELHDEAISEYLAQANPRQVDALRRLLRRRRDLDTRNPRRESLGNDFGRMGLKLIPALQNRYGRAGQDLARLELLVDFRNAVVHGNESEVHSLTRKRPIAATLRSYHLFRSTCDRLVRRLDAVVAAELAAELQISQPW